MNIITLLKVVSFVMLLTVDDDNEARRERYYQFARPTRSCRLKHSQVRNVGSILIGSIIGNLSSCIRTKLSRVLRVCRVRLGRRMFLEEEERKLRGSILLRLWLRGKSVGRRSRRFRGLN